MTKFALLLLTLCFSVTAVAKARYLEVQVDVGACINTELLPQSAKHGKLWILTATGPDGRALRITSGRTQREQEVAELRYHPGYFSGPVFNVVIAMEEENTSEIRLTLEEKKRGLGRSDKTRELLSFDPSSAGDEDIKLGADAQSPAHCVVVYR
jgi:hypothetical protein